MNPMPMMPRLPKGGIKLPPQSSISTQLAESSSRDDADLGDQKPAAKISRTSMSRKEPPQTLASSNDNYCPLPMEQEQHHSSFSNLDLFKLDDYADDDMLINSAEEQMGFDESILSLVTGDGAVIDHFQPYHHQLQQCGRVVEPDVGASRNPIDPYVLHRTVLLFPNDAGLVQTALVSGPPHAVLTPSAAPHHGYSFPLHLGLLSGANLPVIQILVQAGPQVLIQKDGPQGLTPLLLAVTHLPNRPDVHQLLRKAWPDAARIACDGNQDLPLHVACRNSCRGLRNCVALIQGLLQDYPQGAGHTNRHGLMPLQIVAMQPPSAPHRNLIYQSLQQAYNSHPQQSRGMAASRGGGFGSILTVSP